MPGAGLTGTSGVKALSERPALQPYWGKPAVRNDRGDDGNFNPEKKGTKLESWGVDL